MKNYCRDSSLCSFSRLLFISCHVLVRESLFVSPSKWMHLYLRSIKQQIVVANRPQQSASDGVGSIYFAPKNKALCWGRLDFLQGVFCSPDASGKVNVIDNAL